MQENKVDKKKIVARVLVICAAALMVLAAAAGVYLSRQYVRLGQQLIPVSATTLDLRGSGVPDLSALERCTALTELDVRENDLSADEITQRVLSGVKPGSIVLFHNAALHTPEALPGIIDSLQKDGYTFVKIADLIADGDYTIDHTGRQFSA